MVMNRKRIITDSAAPLGSPELYSGSEISSEISSLFSCHFLSQQVAVFSKKAPKNLASSDRLATRW